MPPGSPRRSSDACAPFRPRAAQLAAAKADAEIHSTTVVPVVESLMEAVAQGPVSVAIEADQRAFQMYHSGVFSATCGTKLDHGVLAVGCGSDSELNVDYWKVKNSWGEIFGEQGYIRLARKSGAGECGIDMDASYPVVSGTPGPGPAPGPVPPSPPSPL